MRPLAGPLDLLDHEAPASRPLQCKLGLTTRKLLKPLPHRSSRRGHDPAAPNLTRLPVERLVRDLPSMHIQCDYDPHRDLLELRRDERHRVRTTLEPRGSHYMSSLQELTALEISIFDSSAALSGVSLRQMRRCRRALDHA